MIRLPMLSALISVTVLSVASVDSVMADPTLVVKWNDTLLECIRRSRIGPPMVARAIGVTHTCGFDAWAMYEDVAVPTQLRAERRPAEERTVANREKAYSYAEYQALLDLFPAQSAFIRQRMTAFGYDPDDTSTDPTTPSGLGTLCANAVTELRHGDGSNQLGDLHAGAYTDYTGYVPVNTVDHIADPNHWQPLSFCDGQGGVVTPGYIAPHWGSVLPFALTSWDQFELAGPKRFPNGRYVAQATNILHLNAHLTDEQKMIAEYWADGPRSELPPGHFTLFAEFVSSRDQHSFDDDVKLFFILGNAMLDAGIAVWGNKRLYDSERPITAIRFLKAGKKVLAYVPFKGPQLIDGADWIPYQPCSFVTPPFPEYPSGHSAFSSAGAEVLKRFTGSDAFGGAVTFAPGSGRVEPGYAPATEITLSWPTFSDAADEAGISRRYGGIHFEDGDLDSRRLGRLVAAAVWDKAQEYIHGATKVISSINALPIASAGPSLAASPTTEAIAESAIASVTPNPGRGEHQIDFLVSRYGHVQLDIVDIQGRAVVSLVDGGAYPTGRHRVAWAGNVKPGIYLARLRTPGMNTVRRIAVVN